VTKIKKVDAWATLFKTFTRLHQKMEDSMKARDLPTLEIYDVLWTLEQATGHKLRFSDLGEKVYISRCHVTRISERLEKSGHIKRVPCEIDRRGVWAQLTSSGLALRKKMWGVYGQLIEEQFSSHLSEEEHRLLIKVLGQVKIEY
jgi:DNA-binding MarR family transcriptional regulator